MFLASCGGGLVKSPSTVVDNSLDSSVVVNIHDSVKVDTTPQIDSSKITINDTIKNSIIPDSIGFGKLTLDSIPYFSPKARVILEYNRLSVTLLFYGKVRAKSSLRNIRIGSGRIGVESVNGGLMLSAHGKSGLVAEPCTLSVISGDEIWGINGHQYHGEVIISKKSSGKLNIINNIKVEEYLRGVVPLEIGKKGERDFEALKAQAIAARTYTYSRLFARKDWEYDLKSTVADQVYGGVEAEYYLTDKAIKETENMVMTYNKTLIEAYYCSTCGGVTSSIDNVWQTTSKPYLKSVKDRRSDGSAWCGISPLVNWSEVWTIAEFESALKLGTASVNGVAPYVGRLKTVAVTETFSSGRVKTLRVVSDKGMFTYGGDRVRFVLRRPISGNPILRSALFTISIKDGKVVAKGHGYGHGIGMCQMGAIGRARDGQTFTEILKSYYSGIDIESVEDIYGRESRAVN